MATSKVLQAPAIIGITGSTIAIQHPDISTYPRTYLTAPFTAAGVTLTIADNDGFANADVGILGEVYDSKTEQITVNAAVTRGTSLTITNTTKFSHELHAPVTKIFEKQIRIYGAATNGGSGTLVTTVDIQWDKPQTTYTLVTTDTAYAYYYAKFYDGTTESSASGYVASTGLSNASVAKLIEAGLKEAMADIDKTLITRDWLLTVANDWQDEVSQWVTQDGIPMDWTFQLTEDSTLVAITNENAYALSGLASTLEYQNSNTGIMSLRIGSYPCSYIDQRTYDQVMTGVAHGVLETQATSGATSITLVSSAEFTDSGSATLGGDIVTYTANDKTTGVLSGIPASGDGSITATNAAGVSVWQNITAGLPAFFTISNGYLLFTLPIHEDYENYPITFRAIKSLSRLTSFSSSTVITFTNTAPYYIASRIESRKGNTDNAQRLMAQFKEKMEMAAHRYGLPVATPQYRWNVNDTTLNDSNDVWRTNQ